MKAIVATETQLDEPPTADLVIDCDAHPIIPEGVRPLMDYLSRAWRERLQDYTAMPGMPGYVHPGGSALRGDAQPSDGVMAGSDPAYFARDLLDGWGIARVVLTVTQSINTRVLPNADNAAAFASAYNDFMAERWMSVDDRFLMALVVAPQDPTLAVKEINRFADTRGVVAVLLPLADILMGNRHYYPVYEAAMAHGLPIFVHPSATDIGMPGSPNSAGGRPSSYFERHACLPQAYQANVISLIGEGVFERYRELKVVMAEVGYGWVPHVMWRLDQTWIGLRREIPWVKMPPSEYIAAHIRFTSQPFEQPRKPAHVLQMLDMMQADRTLLLSSDYPHWDNDDPNFVLAGMPDALRHRVTHQNAIETFGARLGL